MSQNYVKIAKNLNVKVDLVTENIALLAGLEPIPARKFKTESVHYVIPDVYVFKVGENWVVSLNEEGLPKLQINDYYKDVGADLKSGGTKKYITEQMKSASWLIRSLQQRQKTIFKVSECIVNRQKSFFEQGFKHLKPMVLRDIADDIEMHESTISRVTTNKYMHTPQGGSLSLSIFLVVRLLQLGERALQVSRSKK